MDLLIIYLKAISNHQLSTFAMCFPSYFISMSQLLGPMMVYPLAHLGVYTCMHWNMSLNFSHVDSIPFCLLKLLTENRQHDIIISLSHIQTILYRPRECLKSLMERWIWGYPPHSSIINNALHFCFFSRRTTKSDRHTESRVAFPSDQGRYRQSHQIVGCWLSPLRGKANAKRI